MLGQKPRCLLEVVERHQSWDVVSWDVLLPNGSRSGMFRNREDALDFAKVQYPTLPEEVGG
jgi:hypothetical protein